LAIYLNWVKVPQASAILRRGEGKPVRQKMEKGRREKQGRLYCPERGERPITSILDEEECRLRGQVIARTILIENRDER